MLVILGSDFNCLIHVAGCSNRANSRLDTMSRLLIETLKDVKLHDIFSNPADRMQHRFSRSGSICGGENRLNVSGLVTLPQKDHRTRNVNSVFSSADAARPAELF
eukprot:g39350.t1